MIYDGRRGYLSGDLTQAVNTVLAMTKGPIKGRNWVTTTINPAYSITISSGATGAVKLQGTNDVALQDAHGLEGNPIESDFLPTEGASWVDIATTSASTTGTIAVEYQFLRLIVSTSNPGFVTQAWVKWF